MIKYCLLYFSLFWAFSSSYAQRERGKVVKAPKIFQKSTSEENNPELKDKNFNNSFENEVDFIFEEEPKLRFSNKYEPNNTNTEKSTLSGGNSESLENSIRIEPIRKLNQNTHDDTSSIDEGDLMIVEIEESAQFPGSDEMVKIASYFSIWDTRSVDPYGINPNSFDEVVPIKLYDISEGRYWAPPLDKNPITSHFGWRWKRWHKGTDLDLETGDPVYATFDGIIRVAGTQSGWGRTIVVRHYNGLETLYGHLSKINFEENTVVKAGDQIGRGGSTGRSSGSHLHYEARYEGNPFDAENIFAFSRDKTEIRMQELLLTPHFYDYLRGGKSRVKSAIDGSEIVPEEGSPASLSDGGDEESGDEESFEEEEEEVPVKVVTTAWYRVRPGDNLSKIATNYGTTVAKICQLNKISSYRKLYVGTRLRVK